MVFTGPMCSGKTASMLSMIEILQRQELPILIFKPSFDTRDEGVLRSRTGAEIEAIVVKDSASLVAHLQDREKPHTVFIEEVQFFDAGLVDVVLGLLKNKIYVVCSGLDLSFKMKPFPVTQELMAHADKVIKKRAVCAFCSEYTARVSFKLDAENNPSELDVGGDDRYVPVCRSCYTKNFKLKE